VIKLLVPPAITCAFALLSACSVPPTQAPMAVGMVSSSRAQELEVRCDAFQRNPLGVWFATEQLT
jgi:hypothetical protein